MTYIDEMVKELCPNGVEWKELGEVVDYEQPTKYIVKSKEYSDDYSVPVLTAGQTFILGYTNEETGIYLASKEHSVIIFDDFTTARKWVDFEFKVKSSAMKILSIKSECQDEVSIRYVWHYLGTIKYTPEQHARQWIGTFSKFKIPLPPLEIQNEIVKILDKFTDYVTELTAELTFRQKQYSYFRDKLLSFDDESMGGVNNKVYTVQWKTLGEVAIDFGRGKSKHRPRNDSRLYGGTTPFIQTGDIRNSKGRITEYTQTYSEFGLAQSKLWKKGTLCITIAANIAEMGILDFDACFPDSVVGFLADENIALTKYIAYYLASIKDVLASKSTGSAQENLNLSSFSTLKIPLPSLATQSRIVEVLDKFDTVCNDLNIGLPKEIELRQKQYEFFRDKLLTFTATGVYTDSTVLYRQDMIRLLTWVFGPIKVELGAVCDVVRGKRVVKSQLHPSEGYPVYQNSLTTLGYFEHYNREAETAFLISAGAAGEVGYTRSRCWTADDVWTFDTEVIDQRYLYYLLMSKQETVKTQVRTASVPRLSKSAIENLVFILPLIDQQNHIVSILDRFDTLTTDLSQGLPAEIEQRQKQYAYWRDRLLSF